MAKKIPDKGKTTKAKKEPKPDYSRMLPAVIPKPPKPDIDKGGRPSLISPEMANEICLLIAEGYTIRQVSQLSHLPSKSTILRWASGNEPARKWFRDQYARAREVAAWGWFDEMFDIADDGRNDWIDRETGRREDGSPITTRVLDHEHVMRSKMRLDLRKWGLSKFLKNTFGKELEAKPDATNSGAPQAPKKVIVYRQPKPDK